MRNSNDSLNTSITHACIVLGLPPPFTAEKAKARYRELAKLYHPDVGAIKDGGRFAEISRAYELIEANIQRLATFELVSGSDGESSRVKINELLNELHAARTQTVTAEALARQMGDEAEAMRRYYGATQAGSRKGIYLASLTAIATAALGFLAGIFWSYQSPNLRLKPDTKFNGLSVTWPAEVTTAPLEGYPSYALQIQPNVAAEAAVIFSDNGNVKNSGGVAILNTTPTITLTKTPVMKYLLIQSPTQELIPPVNPPAKQAPSS